MMAGAALLWRRIPLVRLTAALLAAFMPVARLVAGAQAPRAVGMADSSVLAQAPRSWDLLARRVTLQLDDVPLEDALRAIAQRCEMRFSYSSDIVPVARRVSLSMTGATVAQVLNELLHGTDVDYVVTPSGYVVLVKGPTDRLPRPRLRWEDQDGRVVTEPSIPSLRPQLMDRVIVMGTPVTGAPERGLASAVTVLTAGQIAALGAGTMEDLLRNAIPGVTAWDLGMAGPFAHVSSVRGSSSFTSNYLKTYVDGVELASPYMLFAIDPYSIERIEIIRGPQGSALYGSDAISGVVQVVTRRGSVAARWRPTFDGAFTAGVMQSRYVDGASGAERQSAMVSTGGGMTSLGAGGTWASAGAVAPGGSAGWRGTFGGFRHIAGPLRLEGTLRYADIRFTAPDNPLFRAESLPPSLRAPAGEQHIQNETYGATLDYQPAPAWRQTLVLGIDRNAGAIPPQREPATVADALLGATREKVSKTSLRYSTALRLFEGTRSTGTLTLGAERANLARERLGTSLDLAGSGEGLAALYRDDVHNTGLFGQLKVDLASSLFLSAGLRGERNSSFGEHYGTAWSPMLGAAYTRDMGLTTAKVRLAYGKGIRPPAPSARQGIATVAYRQQANPLLEPESQSGIEGGIELYRGDRAALAVTGYVQHADGLIQEVIVNQNSSRAVQYQNVGRIGNRGVEVEGTARSGGLRLSATLAFTESRVRALSATYSGDLAVGDRVPEVPGASGLFSLSRDVASVHVSLGTSYIGSWRGYDWVAFIDDQLSDPQSTSSLRSYLRRYPAIAKPFVMLNRPLGRGLEWFGRVDNLTNVQRNERDNLQITAGRTFTLGLRVGR